MRQYNYKRQDIKVQKERNSGKRHQSVASNIYGEKLLNPCCGVNSHVWKPVEDAGLTGIGQWPAPAGVDGVPVIYSWGNARWVDPRFPLITCSPVASSRIFPTNYCCNGAGPTKRLHRGTSDSGVFFGRSWRGNFCWGLSAVFGRLGRRPIPEAVIRRPDGRGHSSSAPPAPRCPTHTAYILLILLLFQGMLKIEYEFIGCTQWEAQTISARIIPSDCQRLKWSGNPLKAKLNRDGSTVGNVGRTVWQ